MLSSDGLIPGTELLKKKSGAMMNSQSILEALQAKEDAKGERKMKSD